MAKTAYTIPKICDCGGSLTKPWYVHFRFVNPNNPSERKQFRYKKGINYYTTTAERRAEAKALKIELTELLKDGWSPFDSPNPPTEDNTKPQNVQVKRVGETLAKMYALKELSLRKESKRTYIYKYRHFVAWLDNMGYACLPIEGFGKGHAMEYLDHCTQLGFNPRHWNYHRAIAKGLFEMAVEREFISENPFSKTKKVKTPSKGSAVMYEESLRRKVRDHLRAVNFGLLVFCDFIYYTFMRPNELIQLQIKHFDFDNYRIKLPKHISKNDIERIVELPPALHDYVDSFRDEAINTSIKDLFTPYSEYYVFGWGVRPHPKRYAKRDSVTDMFREQVRIPLELPKGYTPYPMKHTGIDAATKKYDVVSTMKQSGHQSLKNFQIYLRSLNTDNNEVFANADF